MKIAALPERYEPADNTNAARAAQAASGRVKVALALVSVYLIWGCSYLATREAIQTIPPLLMAGGRILFAGSVLYCGLRLRGVANPRKAEWLASTEVSIPLITIASGATAFAQQYVDSGVAAVAFATSPLWMAVFSGFMERWPGGREWIGIALGSAGVLLLNTHTHLRVHPVAAAALMLASLSWAFGSVLSRHLPRPSNLMASASQLLVGGAALLLLGLICGERLNSAPSLGSVAALAYLAIFSSLIGFSAFTYLVRHARPGIALSHAYVNPVVAVAVGAIFAGELVTSMELAAMLLVSIALVFITMGGALDAPAEAAPRVPLRTAR